MVEKNEIRLSSSDKFLIDFDRQKLDEYKDNEDFETQRKNFYESLKNQPKGGFGATIGDKDLQEKLDLQERERLQWEKEALESMNQDIDEIDSLKKRYNVMQSYDKKLTKEEKEKLGEVLTEMKEDKQELDDIKRLRQQTEMNRQEKLKKLKLT